MPHVRSGERDGRRVGWRDSGIARGSRVLGSPRGPGLPTDGWDVVIDTPVCHPPGGARSARNDAWPCAAKPGSLFSLGVGRLRDRGRDTASAPRWHIYSTASA
jgi:hypothetical protein